MSVLVKYKRAMAAFDGANYLIADGRVNLPTESDGVSIAAATVVWASECGVHIIVKHFAPPWIGTTGAERVQYQLIDTATHMVVAQSQPGLSWRAALVEMKRAAARISTIRPPVAGHETERLDAEQEPARVATHADIAASIAAELIAARAHADACHGLANALMDIQSARTAVVQARARVDETAPAVAGTRHTR